MVEKWILDNLIQIKEKELAARKKITLRCCMAAGCMSSNSQAVKDQLEKAVADAGLGDEVEVRGVGCMSLCCQGPLVAADPNGALYQRVDTDHAKAIVAAVKGGNAGEWNAAIPTIRFSSTRCPSCSRTAAWLIPSASRATSRRTATTRCVMRCTK